MQPSSHNQPYDEYVFYKTYCILLVSWTYNYMPQKLFDTRCTSSPSIPTNLARLETVNVNTHASNFRRLSCQTTTWTITTLRASLSYTDCMCVIGAWDKWKPTITGKLIHNPRLDNEIVVSSSRPCDEIDQAHFSSWPLLRVQEAK